MMQRKTMTVPLAPALDGALGTLLIRDQFGRAARSQADLESWLAGVFPDIKPDLRARAWRFIEALLDTTSHKVAMKRAGVTWAEVFWAKKKSPAFDAEYQAARRFVEWRRQIERADEADRRGVDGWLEPVFGKGAGQDSGTVKVGEIRRFSNRLLELQLRAGDKDRYADRIDQGESGTVVLHFHATIDRSNTAANLPHPPYNA